MAFVPMHPKMVDSPVELKHELGVVKATVVIVADVETAVRLEQVAPEELKTAKLRIVVDSAPSRDSGWIALQSMMREDLTARAFPEPKRSPEDVDFFYFTGESTKHKRGVAT